MLCLNFLQQADSNKQILQILTHINTPAIVRKVVSQKLILNILKHYVNHKIISLQLQINQRSKKKFCLVISKRLLEIHPCSMSNALNQCFSICHLNFNSISTHMFTNVSLLSACIFVHKFDTICLSETYLNSEIPSDDENWEILRYNLAKEDQPSNSKLIGVCLYYKSSLSFKVINVKHLQNSISFELRIGGKCCQFSSFYRSPSQPQYEFEILLKSS